eukprot:Plantae.Rhodophyta-Hildenbrandia_rubra.ctg14477.p2 GENE.Plantae.Rhodophyta-Hildenbrandia_rubra.ctg14477~~Plantae.Rhodophyta-Hildenbrandia_rubra.ctg14477.p2  ORF type:complete len:313 (+),score=49.10 Plantae.Rhodophyta-Hildenbrandia_rubra.ctg14477:632-1570(+)
MVFLAHSICLFSMIQLNFKSEGRQISRVFSIIGFVYLKELRGNIAFVMTAFVPAGPGVLNRTWSHHAVLTKSTHDGRNFVFNSLKQRATILNLTTFPRIAPTCEFNYNIYQDSKDRSKRTVSKGDRSVTIRKPLGAVLEEGQDGMVFVSSLNPDGNAAMEDVRVGDVIVAVSATFGDEVWSVRGVGLDRVLKSIRIRSGDFVTLVLESPAEVSEKKTQAAKTAQDKRVAARETFGEREVLNPVTWTGGSGGNGSQFQGGGQQQQGQEDYITKELKEKLKNEVAAPYEQNWILWIAGGIFVLVILSFITGVLK